jgi:hypothetical protein
MQFIINFEKRHLIFVVILVCVLFVAGVSAFTSPATNIGHDPSEVGPGTFGGEADSVHAFPGDLNVNNNLFFPTNLKGIFWGAGESFSYPHINYDLSNGLWISTGNTGKDVNVETTGNLVADNIKAGNVTAGNIVGNITAVTNITLGGVSRNTWPPAVSGSCTGGNVMAGVNSTGGVVCKLPIVGSCTGYSYMTGIYPSTGAPMCGFPPTGLCPSNQVMDGINPDGSIHCKPAGSCTVSLSSDCINVDVNYFDTWANCPAGRYAARAKALGCCGGTIGCCIGFPYRVRIQCCTPTVTCT